MEKLNKKGNAYIILMLVGLMFLLIFLAFIVIIGSSIINLVADEVVPEISDLGMIGASNLTEYSEYSIDPANNFIQNLTWMTGIFFVFGIVGILGIAFIFKSTGETWMIGLFVGLVLLLVISCIFLSNIYEEFYDGDDDIALRLKEHTLLSYMILYSPAIMVIIAFLSGIILFSGQQEGF